MALQLVMQVNKLTFFSGGLVEYVNHSSAVKTEVVKIKIPGSIRTPEYREEFEKELWAHATMS